MNGQLFNQDFGVHGDHFKFIWTIGVGSAVLLKNTNGTPTEHAEDLMLGYSRTQP
ncbi:hypothetical protein M422DRAFT_257355 [Sphaerobolus stellatus SS14]|uniref:Uncharacterized protein n=1 Tax=Sphaerobolus stellatus (strain SS14) TaxID=990650 RepID=A0A0C9VEC8_SPHS4|nr:hypothetical protein M422DRAFT_257355 [Sphaerobolus stellatus SS14]